MEISFLSPPVHPLAPVRSLLLVPGIEFPSKKTVFAKRPHMSFELFIARRYLKAKRKNSFISLISLISTAGVALGVLALVVVIAVMTGALSEFRTRILGVESHLLLMKYGGNFSEYNQALASVEKVSGIKKASPFIYTQAMIKSPFGISGAIVRGIDPSNSGVLPGKRDLLKKTVKNEGKSAIPGIILGAEFKKSLGVRSGDFIYIISPSGRLSPAGYVPSMRKFEVLDFFDSGMYEYDNSIAYIHIKDAQTILKKGDVATGLSVWVDEINDVERIGVNIQKELKADFVPGSYWTRDWIQMNKSLFAALKMEKTALFVILILIVLVAAFNIASTLIMLVMEKTRDIAILRTMGATDGTIRNIFVLQGMVIGTIGTFLGTAAGVVVCYVLKNYQLIKLPDNYPFSTIPVQLEFMDVTVIAVASLLICFLSTIYPARRAAGLNPVDALRYG